MHDAQNSSGPLHFERLFGVNPDREAHAHGRVNLIGEHTDYNGGFVLPMPIPQRTRVWLAAREGDRVRAASGNFGAAIEEFRIGEERPGRGWFDHVMGVVRLLRETGRPLSGFDLFVSSNVPVGSGLSSSAALEVALLKGLRDLFQLELTDIQLAQLGQRVENEFVGAKVGIMDQMVCAIGEAGAALFLDTRSLAYEQIKLPKEAQWIVINSCISHQHAAGDYNTRRAECEEGCRLLGVAQLRDLAPADLERLGQLPADAATIARRVRHVVSENERVLDAVAAIKADDLERLGLRFIESHWSQSRDYEVSIPEIDRLVEIACAHPAILGARLTGGGFGGSIVAFCRHGDPAAIAAQIVAVYNRRAAVPATVLVPEGL